MGEDKNTQVARDNAAGPEEVQASNALLWKLLIALGSILFLLAAAEGFARFYMGVRPVPDRFQLSHQLGWEWTPGYDAVESDHGVDYRMQISRQGLRNESVLLPKPPGTYRIIALGDSITEGPGVEWKGPLSNCWRVRCSTNFRRRKLR